MRKQIDWKATAQRARKMSDESLAHARKECAELTHIWANPDTDPDGNGSYYADEGSVYATEQKRRSK